MLTIMKFAIKGELLKIPNQFSFENANYDSRFNAETCDSVSTK